MSLEAKSDTGPEQQPIDEAVQKAALIFDEVAFLGNSLPLPQTVSVLLPGTGALSISTFPQKFERAEVAFVKVDCTNPNGERQGTVFLAGCSSPRSESGEWSWALTSKPGQVGDASERARALANEYIIPLAQALDELGVAGQDEQIDMWRSSLQDRRCRRIAMGLRHLRKTA